MTRTLKIIAAPIHLKSLGLIALSWVVLLIGSWQAEAITWLYPLLLLLGLFTWTLAEYLMHRYLFHLPTRHPLAFLGARMHAMHHAAPKTPPITKPPSLTLGTFWALSLLLFFLIPLPLLLPGLSGALLGYFLYEVAHVASHTLTEDEHPFPGWQKNHLLHHQRPSTRFGISTPLWDKIFSTQG